MSHPRSPWRWPAAALLLANAVIHLLLVPQHLEEAPYVGVAFLGLSVLTLVLAVRLITVDTAMVWAASGVISLSAVIGFLASRTVGLPQIRDDIGNWGTHSASRPSPWKC